MTIIRRMMRAVAAFLCLAMVAAFLCFGNVSATEVTEQTEQIEQTEQTEQTEETEQTETEPVESKPVVRKPANVIGLTNVSSKVNGDKFKKVYLSWTDQDGQADGYAVYIDGKYYSSITPKSTVKQAVSIKYKKGQNVKLRAFILENGKKKYGSYSNSVKCNPAALGTTKVHVTKISGTKVRIYWKKVPHATGYYVYRNSAFIKKVTGGKHDLVYERRHASRKSYSVVPYYKDEAGIHKSAKKTCKTVASNKWYSSFKPGPKYYGWTCTNYVHVNKVYYSKSGSKGRLKAKFTITNTWKGLETRKAYVTLTVKSQGVVIAKQRFKVKHIDGWSKKTFKVKFKSSKKGYDLTRGGGCIVTVGYKYYQ